MARRLARLDRLLRAAESAYEAEHNDACLILLYSLLDVLGAVSRDPGKDKGDGGDFRRWVTDYVLSKCEVGATAEDLWSARCGILHTLSHESDHIEDRRARIVLYSLGAEDGGDGRPWRKVLLEAIKRVPSVSKVPPEELAIVHLGTLLAAVRAGFEQYGHEVLGREDLDQQLTDRMDAALTTIYVG